MKGFFKTLLASFIGIFVAMFLGVIVLMSVISSLGVKKEQAPQIPKSAILKIADVTIGEQTVGGELDATSMIMNQEVGTTPSKLGILTAIQAIDKAAEDPSIKFIYINPTNINTELTTLEELRSALVRFKESGKAIISYAEDYTQGGYYLASVSDKIYVNPFGSNMMFGVGSSLMFFKGALDKLGVEVQLIRHGKYKSAGEQFVNTNISEANREQNQAMITSIWKSMSSDICESRNIDEKTFNKHINNLSATMADEMVAAGLADALMTRDEMTAELVGLFGVEKEEDVKMINLSKYASVVVKPNYKAKEKIAIIYADGDINKGNGEGITSDKYAKIISDVRKDSTVKAVLLRVNSPGGDAVAAEIIRKELELLKAAKPIVVSYGNYAASGGYWISAEGDKIFTNETTLTGSIGVFSMIPNFNKIIKEKAGINIVEITSNDHANMMSLFSDKLDKVELDYMQRSVEVIYDSFLSIVSNGRNMSTEEVDKIAQGRVWSGTDAMKVGLTDEIGTIKEALDYTVNISGLTDYQLVEYPKTKNTLEKFIEMMQKGQSSIGTITNPEMAMDELIEYVKEIKNTTYARMEYDYVFHY